MKSITYDDTLWQLVPKEATTPMVNAGECGCMDNDVTVTVYRRMLSAAPTPPAQPAERVPLSLKQIGEIEHQSYEKTITKGKSRGEYVLKIVRDVEAAHGIKGES